MAKGIKTNVLRYLDAHRIPYETVAYDRLPSGRLQSHRHEEALPHLSG